MYLNKKVAHTTLTDVREVMHKCVVTVSFFVFLLTPVIRFVLVVLGCQKKNPEPARSTLQRL